MYCAAQNRSYPTDLRNRRNLARGGYSSSPVPVQARRRHSSLRPRGCHSRSIESTTRVRVFAATSCARFLACFEGGLEGLGQELGVLGPRRICILPRRARPVRLASRHSERGVVVPRAPEIVMGRSRYDAAPRPRVRHCGCVDAGELRDRSRHGKLGHRIASIHVARNRDVSVQILKLVSNPAAPRGPRAVRRSASRAPAPRRA